MAMMERRFVRLPKPSPSPFFVSSRLMRRLLLSVHLILVLEIGLSNASAVRGCSSSLRPVCLARETTPTGPRYSRQRRLERGQELQITWRST